MVYGGIMKRKFHYLQCSVCGNSVLFSITDDLDILGSSIKHPIPYYEGFLNGHHQCKRKDGLPQFQLVIHYGVKPAEEMA